MEREFLELAVWDQFTPREAETVARALGRCLPALWTFDRVEPHACGDQSRQVAFFRGRDGANFALVPGGTILLGHDPARPLGAPLRERREWLETSPLPQRLEDLEGDVEDFEEDQDAIFEYDSWSDFFAWLGDLPGPRSVRLTPFLLEVDPRPCRDMADGLTFAQLVEKVAAEGLRLPTSDEWEHACAGGARTVWRWGDFCPDHSPEDGGNDLLHYRPNAFGLRYHGSVGELCAEAGVRRNTDGGVALCGGHGWPCAWLAQASAFVRDYYALGWDGPEKPLSPHLRVRRALSVPEEALD